MEGFFMNGIEGRRPVDIPAIAENNRRERQDQRFNRRQFLAVAGTVVSGLIVLPWTRSIYEQVTEPLPTLPPAPTSEATPAPEPIDLSQKDAEFRLMSDLSLRDLGLYNRDMIYEIARKFAEFDLPEVVTVKKDWRDDDGGYTRVTPRKAELSAESGELVIVEPGRIDISSDLFRGDVGLRKREIELQHAAAKLIFTNYKAGQDEPVYRYARQKGADTAKGELSAVHDGYADWLDRAAKHAIRTGESDYPEGFYAFNEYTYLNENERDEADMPKQNGRMETDIADYTASVINTAMLFGYDEKSDNCMARRIGSFPIIKRGVPPGAIMGMPPANTTPSESYFPTPQKALARDGYDKTTALLETLVKPGIRKPESATERLIRHSNEIYKLIHDDSPDNNRVIVGGGY